MIGTSGSLGGFGKGVRAKMTGTLLRGKKNRVQSKALIKLKNKKKNGK